MRPDEIAGTTRPSVGQPTGTREYHHYLPLLGWSVIYTGLPITRDERKAEKVFKK
jgi:hypothetical protein